MFLGTVSGNIGRCPDGLNGFGIEASRLVFTILRLGPAGDEAFEFVSRLDGINTASHWTNQTYVSLVYDTARRSDVIKIAGGNSPHSMRLHHRGTERETLTQRNASRGRFTRSVPPVTSVPLS